MKYVGIDIGSTASKAVVMDGEKKNIIHKYIIPSGWNSKETSVEIMKYLKEQGLTKENAFVTATGYGRISVEYADKTLTEITCHGKGAAFLKPGNFTIIDIGGQDTKVIVLRNGKVIDFLMNDKCSAGTGKFLEIMANRLGLGLQEMFDYARRGKEISISSMCTVFAESEVISLMGAGNPKEDIASGVVNSIVSKVSTLVSRKSADEEYFLTGGFCDSDYVVEKLSEKLQAKVTTNENARFAGAIGAALSGD